MWRRKSSTSSCEEMDGYKMIERIGHGAHGVVVKAKRKSSGRLYAIKRIYFKNIEAIPSSIMNEVKIPRSLQCDYIMRVHDDFVANGELYLVFEFMPSGLREMLMDRKKPLTISHLKAYMLMILKGVAFMRDKGIMHRDLKPDNILIGADGILKIGDFGLSRLTNEGAATCEEGRPYTLQVASRWYRAPELLFGSQDYDFGVDLWAIGCIFAEMINKEPLFAGDSDIAQLGIVLSKLGTPTEENWPGHKNLPDFCKIHFAPKASQPFEELLPNASAQCIDLIAGFLKYDSRERTSAQQALHHRYFKESPLPTHEKDLPRPPADHRKTYNMRKRSEQLYYELMSDSISDNLGLENK